MNKANITDKLRELNYDAESLQEEFGQSVTGAVKEIVEQIDAMQSFAENCNIAPAIGTARNIETKICTLKTEINSLLQNNKRVPTSKVFALSDFIDKTSKIVQDLEDFTDINCSCNQK